MSERNDEISASHQASSEAAAAIARSQQNAEELQALLAERDRKNGPSLRGFFANALGGLKNEPPKAAVANPSATSSPPGIQATGSAPAGLETFVQDPFLHLREARAARQQAMAPTVSTTPKPVSGPSVG